MSAFEGKPGHRLALRLNSAFDPFETIDRAMSPFLKPVKSGRFYVAALEAGRAESSARERAASVPSAGIGPPTSRHSFLPEYAAPKGVATKLRQRLRSVCPIARGAIRDREENMNRPSVFSTSVLMVALGVALLPSNVVGQQKSIKEQLVGTWTCVSSTTKLPNGSPAWGTNPKGLLIFTENGYFSSQIVRSDLPKFASNNRAQGTPEENKAVVQGSIANFGTYTVDETKKAYTLKFEGSSFPNRTETEQTRAFTADELKVANPSTSIGGSSELVYKRAK